MGDASTPLTGRQARHLLRRAGFGAARSQRDLDRIIGKPRGEVVAKLVEFRPSRFKPRGDNNNEIQDKWLKYMLRFRRPLQEKMTVFWHDHFATNAVDVNSSSRTIQQNELLRQHCLGVHRRKREQIETGLPPRGNFRDFVKAINKDPAMMRFLNTEDNRKEIPNENYPRELLELFCLGVLDSAGNPNYQQEDIVQIARAFTGWRTRSAKRNTREAYLDDNRHDFMEDFPDRGPKVIFRNIGGFDNNGRTFAADASEEGEAEIDRVIDIVFEHTDTDGKNTVARYITRRVITFLAHPDPELAFVDDVITNSGFDTNFDVREMVRWILLDDRFYESAETAGPGTRKSVKFPVDFVVGTLSLLRIRPRRSDLRVNGLSSQRTRDYMTEMGMRLLEPPSVFGWDWEEAWLGSTRMKERYQFAVDVTRASGAGSASIKFNRLMDLTLTDPADIVDAALQVLQVDDQFPDENAPIPNDRQTLIDYMGPGPIDLIGDESAFNNKLRGLFALIIQSPAYQVY